MNFSEFTLRVAYIRHRRRGTFENEPVLMEAQDLNRKQRALAMCRLRGEHEREKNCGNNGGYMDAHWHLDLGRKE